jgi:penicillin-binding protein 1C
MPGEYISAEVCPLSGHLKGPHCEICDTLDLPVNALRSTRCPYHKILDNESYFILPPAMEWFYKQYHPEYTSIPTSKSNDNTRPMEFIYPENGSKIIIPNQLDGTPGKIIFNLAHYDTETEIFWHLDQDFIGTTKNIHQMSVRPDDGRHTMTVVDNKGYSLTVNFSCYRTEKR